MLTLEDLRNSLGKEQKAAATPEVVDSLNKLAEGEYEVVRENFITYASVLSSGKYSVPEYLNAIKFVSFKLLGDNNTESYKKTFPDRHLRLVSQGADEKKIGTYASAYSKTKLVTSIMNQAYIPSWLINQDAYQKAVNTQVALLYAKSEKVRCMAADSLLKHLARPEEAGPLININATESTFTGLEDLKNSLGDLVVMQKKLLEKGVPTKVIAEQEIIDVRAED